MTTVFLHFFLCWFFLVVCYFVLLGWLVWFCTTFVVGLCVCVCAEVDVWVCEPVCAWCVVSVYFRAVCSYLSVGVQNNGLQIGHIVAHRSRCRYSPIKVRIAVNAFAEWCPGNRWTLFWYSPYRRRMWSAGNNSACHRHWLLIYAANQNDKQTFTHTQLVIQFAWAFARLSVCCTRTKNSSRIKYLARITSGSSPGSINASPAGRRRKEHTHN